MSFYVYSTEDGKVEERYFPIGKAPKLIYISGQKAHRNFQLEHHKTREPWASTPGGYPKESWAMGVHPKQVPEAVAKFAKAGVPTEFNKRTGDPIITSLSHQRKVQKVLGLIDRAGWY